MAFDPSSRYSAIDHARDTLNDLNLPDLADDPAMIVEMIVIPLSRDQQFIDYVIDGLEQDLSELTDWGPLVEAYAWSVLQRYNKDQGGQDE